MTTTGIARIQPLAEGEGDEDTQELLGGRTANLFLTLAKHPDLFGKFDALMRQLNIHSTLPARDRELLTLRTGWNCACEYEWGQHVRLARAAGLSDAEIIRVTEGPSAAGWSEFETTLLNAADQLHRQSTISDQTWAELAREYDERRLIEVCLLIGQYHVVSFALNGLQIQFEEELPGLGAVR